MKQTIKKITAKIALRKNKAENFSNPGILSYILFKLKLLKLQEVQ